MKFFVDNCISPRYAKALRILAEKQNNEIIHLKERFDQSNIKDEEWLRILSNEGDWVVVSGDVRITRGKAERKAWSESGLKVFFFDDNFAKRNFWTQAEEVIHWWPKIVDRAKNNENCKGYRMPYRGKEFKAIY